MPGADEADERRLAELADELATLVESALPGWVERSVGRLVEAWRGEVPDDVAGAARGAGDDARRDVGPAVRRVLTADVDAGAGSPLAILRGAVRYPTAVLREAGVPPVVRDDFAERRFPDDVYDLAPASFADIDPALHEPGLVWGAAKAHVFLSRRRAEGKR
jgi:hypothetical protein